MFLNKRPTMMCLAKNEEEKEKREKEKRKRKKREKKRKKKRELPGGEGTGRLCLILHCHRQNDSALGWAVMRAILMFSLTVKSKVTRLSCGHHCV